MREIAPYGAWASPLTPDVMTGRNVGLSMLRADGAALYWLEARPGEAGRTTLIRWTATDGPVDLTPLPRDVGSRVHEYGGGAYAAADGRVVYSDKKDGRVRLIAGGETRLVAAVDGCRYADFAFDPIRDRVLAIREDHRGRPPNAPRAALVALPLAPSDPQGNEGIVLRTGPDFIAAPRPSPDGNRLAWIEWDHPDMPWDATRLMVAEIAPDGGAGPPVRIAGAAAEAVLQPEWDEDGALLFLSDRTGWWNLYRRSGGETVALAPEPAETGGPAWQLGGCHFAILPDGRIACATVEAGRRRAGLIAGGLRQPLPLGAVAQSPVPFEGGLAALVTPADAPAAIVLAERPEAANQRVLKIAGPPLLTLEEISAAEAVSFPTGAGDVAHGFFYPPCNPRFAAPDGTLPPLVVLGHGGPTAMASDAFSLAVQWWTSRGFAVMDVNYRGSSGYGRDYRDRLRGAWGVADVEDCIAAAGHLTATGRIDPDRVAIRGGSAGGFTVLAALTRSTIFKAGASLYGIGDLALLARDTHKFEARYLDRLVGPLPEAAATYRERSPLHRLDSLAAPVIFFQGLDDRVVPPNQAETMVAAMQRNGSKVAYYAFAGEGHGFRRAETIKRVLELELGFYGLVFGFSPPGLSETVRLLPATS